MTNREKRYIFIIATLLQKTLRVIDEANAHIAKVEAEVNTQLEAMVEKQIRADEVVLEVWEQNTGLLWQENQELKARLAELERGNRKPKIKAKQRREWAHQESL